MAKRPVPETKCPPKIKGMGYVPFFENNRERAQDEPFYKGYGTTVAQQYWDSIQDVASRLEKSLAELAGIEIEKKRRRTAPAKGVTVYLAVPSSDLKDAHYSLRKELESQGCHVVPSDPWPNDPVAAEAHLRAAVAIAQLSIHLLGAAPGSDQASGLSNLCRLQLDLVAQRADADFRRLIWLPEGSIAADETQKLLIEGLEKGDGLRAQDELVRSGAESFKEVVRAELSRLVGTAAKPSRIYLMCDAIDEAEALALRPPLVEAGFEVELPEFAADGKVPPEEHQRCLRGCETVLAFWGKTPKAASARDAGRNRRCGRRVAAGRALRARGLYLGAPESPRKANFASNYADVILRDFAGIKATARAPESAPEGGPVTALSAKQPYPGLRPFDLGDEEFFFGREAQTRSLYAKLKVNRLIAVVGRSGCGKSSLVRAGLVPLLKAETAARQTTNWRIAMFRPQGRPLRELSDALLGLKAEGRDEAQERPGAETQALRQSRMDAMLRRDSLGLVEAARELLRSSTDELLIVVDQFEEIFRFGGTSRGDAEEATTFVRLLVEAINVDTPRIHVLLTMRLDFLGDCARFPRLPEAISDGQFLVPNLSRAERRAAIEEPAKKFGKQIKPEVTQRLLNEIGEDPDQLPVLQHVLMRMWQQAGDNREITLADYDQTGGVKNAITQHADQIFTRICRPTFIVWPPSACSRRSPSVTFAAVSSGAPRSWARSPPSSRKTTSRWNLLKARKRLSRSSRRFASRSAAS